MFFQKKPRKAMREHGFTLIETVLGVAIFVLVAGSLFATYVRVFDVVKNSQARVNAMALADEQFEIARNLPYSQVGLLNGIPAGSLIPYQTIVRGGKTYAVTTTVRNIDQPFDGTAGGSPNDLSPADNKMVDILIDCTSCLRFIPLEFTTIVAPKDLEGASTNGSLFIRALGSGGLPVGGADVHIYNNTTTSTIDINDITSTSGLLQIIDAPPGFQTYQITVSAPGFSTDRTYGAPTTTNPVKPHATVAVQSVTQLSFSIDRFATVNFSSVTPSCGIVPNVGVQMTGSKLIATSPNVVKHDRWVSTGGSGTKVLDDVEWDNYTIVASSTTYDLEGVVPLSPVTIAPGATQNIQLVMVPKSSPSVVVTVKDLATGLPITGATVVLTKGATTLTQTTGRGYLSQTDWSGGIGTDNQTQFDDGLDVDGGVTPGEVKLLNTFGTYPGTGWLTSATFDTGSISNFYQFTYQPTSQPVDTGDSSVQFQIATASTSGSWEYLGPDGTAGTYYNATTTNISAVHNGSRYLRYKLFMSTASSTVTPDLSDIQFTFTSSCTPPGQVIFQGLGTGTWNVDVTKSGYTAVNDTVTVSAGVPWQEKQVSMAP